MSLQILGQTCLIRKVVLFQNCLYLVFSFKLEIKERSKQSHQILMLFIEIGPLRWSPL